MGKSRDYQRDFITRSANIELNINTSKYSSDLLKTKKYRRNINFEAIQKQKIFLCFSILNELAIQNT